MKHPKILSEDLLLITPPGFGRYLQSFEDWKAATARPDVHLRGLKAKCGIRPEENIWGSPQPHMEIIDGIARIPITGPIGRGLDDYDRAFGAVDSGDIEEELQAANNDPKVRACLMIFDTPGGMYAGTPELADRIMESDRPVFSFVHNAYSAGCWLASATEEIYGTRSSGFGCIGVYSTFMDFSEYARQIGIKVQVFSSGKYKGMGVPGTSLTKEQEKLIQDRIEAMAATFYEHMRATRPKVEDASMQGQTFTGPDGIKAGLADGIVDGEEEVMEMIQDSLGTYGRR